MDENSFYKLNIQKSNGEPTEYTFFYELVV